MSYLVKKRDLILDVRDMEEKELDAKRNGEFTPFTLEHHEESFAYYKSLADALWKVILYLEKNQCKACGSYHVVKYEKNI